MWLKPLILHLAEIRGFSDTKVLNHGGCPQGPQTGTPTSSSRPGRAGVLWCVPSPSCVSLTRKCQEGTGGPSGLALQRPPWHPGTLQGSPRPEDPALPIDLVWRRQRLSEH